MDSVPYLGVKKSDDTNVVLIKVATVIVVFAENDNEIEWVYEDSTWLDENVTIIRRLEKGESFTYTVDRS